MEVKNTVPAIDAKNTRTCIACGLQPSVGKSHIVPRSIYLTARGDDKNLLVLDAGLNNAGKPTQNGHWEPLLCSACEGSFASRFDSPGSQFLTALPSVVPTNGDSQKKTIPIAFPANFRLFVLSVIYRAIHSIDLAWNTCAALWDAPKLLAILDGKAPDGLELYARVLIFDDGGLHPEYVVPPVPVCIPSDIEPYTCFVFGGIEYMARMKRGRLAVAIPQIPISGGQIDVPVGHVSESWAMRLIRANLKQDEHHDSVLRFSAVLKPLWEPRQGW